jgi:hypothetical protein
MDEIELLQNANFNYGGSDQIGKRSSQGNFAESVGQIARISAAKFVLFVILWHHHV